jgi:hypothetical protein
LGLKDLGLPLGGKPELPRFRILEGVDKRWFVSNFSVAVIIL